MFAEYQTKYHLKACHIINYSYCRLFVNVLYRCYWGDSSIIV